MAYAVGGTSWAATSPTLAACSRITPNCCLRAAFSSSVSAMRARRATWSISMSTGMAPESRWARGSGGRRRGRRRNGCRLDRDGRLRLADRDLLPRHDRPHDQDRQHDRNDTEDARHDLDVVGAVELLDRVPSAREGDVRGEVVPEPCGPPPADHPPRRTRAPSV